MQKHLTRLALPIAIAASVILVAVWRVVPPASGTSSLASGTSPLSTPAAPIKSPIAQAHPVPVTAAAPVRGGQAPTVNFYSGFKSAPDLFDYQQRLAARALAGDGRASYYLGLVGHKCHLAIEYYRLMGEHLPDFDRCHRMLVEDPFAGLPAREGGYRWTFWRELAIAQGDPVAELEDAVFWHRDNTARMRAALNAAAASELPEAYFSLGSALLVVGDNNLEALAWMEVACEFGYDCRMDNPRIGMGCVEQGYCVADTTWSQNNRDQFDATPMADIDARAAAIKAALAAGQVPPVTLPGD